MQYIFICISESSFRAHCLKILDIDYFILTVILVSAMLRKAVNIKRFVGFAYALTYLFNSTVHVMNINMKGANLASVTHINIDLKHT